jgi:predicted phosphodiesterase
VTLHIAVIGDVHGNTPALSAALAATRQADRTVLLGDLLTYGPDVDEILTLVEDAVSTRDTLLLRGNHDQAYEDFDRRPPWTRRVPGWIEESMQYVAARVETGRFRRLPWRDVYAEDRVLFAHANPFGVGDWTYLNAADDCIRAAEVLRHRGLAVGVFGHTHRARAFHGSGGEHRFDRPPLALRAEWDELRDAPWVLNAGAVGQPRDIDHSAYVLLLDVHDQACSARFQPVPYDVDAHLAALRRLPLSAATRRRLLEFHLAG